MEIKSRFKDAVIAGAAKEKDHDDKPVSRYRSSQGPGHRSNRGLEDLPDAVANALRDKRFPRQGEIEDH
jgi:hypothetical protein